MPIDKKTGRWTPPEGLDAKLDANRLKRLEKDGPKSSYNPPEVEPPKGESWNPKLDVATNLKGALNDYYKANNPDNNKPLDIPDTAMSRHAATAPAPIEAPPIQLRESLGTKVGKVVEAGAKGLFDGALKATDYINNGIKNFITKEAPKQITENMQESPIFRGFTTPDLQNKNWLDQTGASMRAGTGDMIESHGQVADWLGFKNLANDLKTQGVEGRKGFEAPTQEFSFEHMLDPNFYATTIARAMPSTLTMMATGGPGMIAGKLAAKLAFLKGASPFVKYAIQSAGAGTVSGAYEAALEAGGVYEEARSANKSEAEAKQIANGVFAKQFALLAGTNTLEFATGFAPLKKMGKVGQVLGKPAVGVPLKLAATGLQEGGEEVGQEVINRDALGKPIAWDAAMKETFAAGGTMGVLFGGAGAVHEHLDAIQNGIDKIKQTVISKMSGETRADFLQNIEDAKAQGIPADQAEQMQLDAYAQTEEGQQITAETVQEHLESEQLKKQAQAPVNAEAIISQKTEQPPATVAPTANEQADTATEVTPTAPIDDVAEQKALLEKLLMESNQNRHAPTTAEQAQATLVEQIMQDIQNEHQQAPTATAPLSGTMTGLGQTGTITRKPTPPTQPAVVPQPPSDAQKAPSKLTSAKVGDIVSHRAKKGQAFTVTSVNAKGDKFTLQSEHGGVMKDVHISALVAHEPVAQAPVTEAPQAPTVAPTVTPPKAPTKAQKTVQASDRTDNNLTQKVYIQDGKVKVVSKATNLDHELLPRGFDAESLKMLSHSFDLADYQTAIKSHGNPNWAKSQFFKKQLRFDKLLAKHDHSPLMDRILDSQRRAVDDAIAKFEPVAEEVKKAEAPQQPPSETKKPETITLYHGSDKTFDSFKSNKAQAGEGVFLTDSQDAAKEFGKNLYHVEVQANKIANDDDWKNAHDELENAHIKKMGELETQLEDGEITQAEYDKAENEWIIGESADLEQNAKVSQRLKEQGFDVYQGDLQSGDKGKEYIVLDETAIKSVKNTSATKPAEVQNGDSITVGSTIELDGKQYTVQDVSNPKRFLVKDWMDDRLEISKSLLKPDGQGIIVKLYDGPPDSLDMTVYWNGKENDSLILEEELDPAFYPDGTDTQTMGYDTTLFRIQEKAKYDTGEYVSGDQLFTKDEGINVAEKLLQQKYSPKKANVSNNEQPKKLEEKAQQTPAPKNVLNDHHAKMLERAERARQRIKDKYGSGGTTLNSGLPLDLMADLTIIGYTKILDGVADFKAWSEEMMKEAPHGDRVRKWLPAVFAQAQHIASMSDDEADAFLDEILTDAYGVNPDAPVENEIKKVDNGSNETQQEQATKEGVNADAGATATGTVGNVSQETLAGTPPENVQPAQSEGATGSSSIRGTRADQGSAPEPATAGSGVSDSVGGTTTNVDTAPRRRNNAKSRNKSGELEPSTRNVTTITGNYVITADDDLGIKGKKASFKSNVAAIRLMKKIMAEERQATPEEQKVLVQYVGWGGIAEPFSPAYKMPQEWTAEATELRELLTEAEWQTNADTVLNAHYTSKDVISSIYKGLSHLGFDFGRVLEPSMGIGHFLGLMPSEMASRSKVTGVEIDPITGNMAKLLYPKSDVRIQGFENAKIADGFYDVVIGNVPFGNYGVTDKAYANQPRALTASIHNYFIAKSIDKTRAGGIVMVLTSRYTMDSRDNSLRRYVASKADLVGAVRLPNNAFKKNAGTEVVTDLLIFKKREDGTVPSDTSWVQTAFMQVPVKDGQYPASVEINSYYHSNPQNMLGTGSVESGMYGGREFTLNPNNGQNLPEALVKALESLPADTFVKKAKPSTEEASPQDLIQAPGTAKEQAYVIQGDNLYVNVEGRLQPSKVSKAIFDKVKGLIGIRDAARETLYKQLTDSTEAQITESRKKLNQVYDEFVKKHGPINKRDNASAFAQDPDAYLLLALEHYDAESGKATKADIFSKRTVQRFVPAESADSADSALAISMNELGTVNFNRMSKLTGKSEEQLKQELKGKIFFDPNKNFWVTADEYLSGNVKAKLYAAQNLAEMDAAYQENVDALEQIQPPPLTQSDLDVVVGSHWIPIRHYTDFASHLFQLRRDSIRVAYNSALGEWSVEIPDDGTRSRFRSSTQGRVTWGTRDFDAAALLEKLLNFKSVKIMRKGGEGEKAWFDKKATMAVKTKMNEMQEEFTRWLWSDPARTEELVNDYNERFNTDRLRSYDGSHLTFPGMNPAITLKPHQKDAVWRAVQTGNTLFAHAVGAGKTFEMIAAMMEMKRLGIVNKPMWTVPKHLVNQMGSDFLLLYPAANILVASEKDFEANNRKKLFAKISTGNYDAIIVGHSSFGKVSMSHDTVERFYQAQLAQLELAIQEDVQSGRKSDSGITKKIRKARKLLTEKMNKQLAKIDKDNAVSFEELGIDALIVDEAHEFKNLFYTTKMNRVGGLGNQEGSGKAFDMFMKVRYLQNMNGGRGIIFATGTPVSNSLAEMFTMQRYLQYDELVNRGISHFDAWASQFAKVSNAMELAPEGKGLRQVTKITDMVNLPELQHMFRSFADVKTADELLSKGLITRPELATGTRQPVVVPGSDDLHEFVNGLAERAAAVRSGSVDPKQDNMLNIIGDGRKAALDMRLVDPTASDNPDSKVNVAARSILDIWKKTNSYSVKNPKTGEESVMTKGTQLVFLDLSTPKGEKTDKDGNVIQDDSTDNADLSVYDDLRKKLVNLGIPREQVAFIHDAKTPADKEILYRKVNNGEVRVLMGSSSKMGAGMNVQKRLYALHHLDVPWRPMDVEQREGRILRQGNDNPEVHVFSYITEGSFDAYMWQLIASKAKIVDQTLNGDIAVRRRQDPSAMEMSANQIKALATGDERIVEHANLMQDTQELAIKVANLNDTVNRLTMDIRYLPENRKKAEVLLDLLNQDKKTADTIPDNFQITVGDTVFTDRKDAGTKIKELVELYKQDKETHERLIGKYGDFEVYLIRSEDVKSETIHGYLNGKFQNYYFAIGDSEVGATRSLDMALNEVDGKIKRYQDQIEHLNNEEGKQKEALEESRAKLETARTQLNEKTFRKQELEDALDLAPSAEEQVLDDGSDNGDDGEHDFAATSTGKAITRKRSKKAGGNIVMNLIDTDKHIGPKTTERVADLLARFIGTTIRSMKQKASAEGTFNDRTGVGNVRSRSFGEWRVMGHELGHAFSHAYGLELDQEPAVAGELKALAEKMYPGKLPPKQEAQIQEGFAEFFYLYTTDPQLATTLTPETVTMFEDYISGSKDLANLFIQVRTIIDNDLNESNPFAKGMMAVSSVIETSSSVGAEYEVPWYQRLQFNTVDYVIPAKAIDKEIGKADRIKLERILAVMGDSHAKAGMDFARIAEDHEGRTIAEDHNGNKLRPLKTIMEDALTDIVKVYGWKKKKFAGLNEKMGALHIFTTIALANRVKERNGEGFAYLPLEVSEADAILAQAKQDFPDVLAKAEEYANTLSFIILEKLQRVGQLTAEDRTRIEAGSHFYMPFYYDNKKAASKGSTAGGRTTRQVVKKFTGKKAPVVNLLQATAMKLAEVERVIELQRSTKVLWEALQEPGMGQFGVKFNPPLQSMRISEEEMEKIHNDLIESLINQGANLNSAMTAAQSETLFRAKDIHGIADFENVILYKTTAVENGKEVHKRIFIKLAPDVYEMWQSMNPEPLGYMGRMVSKFINRPFRAFNLLTLSYVKSAVSRDAWTAFIQSKHSRESLMQLFEAIGTSLKLKKNEEAYKRFVMAGGFSGAAENYYDRKNHATFDEGILEIGHSGWARVSVGGKKMLTKVIRSPWDTLRLIDEIPRIAEFVADMKHSFKDLGFDGDQLWKDYIEGGTDALPPEAQEAMEKVLIDAAYASREVTVNMSMHGVNKGYQKLTASVPFLQGSQQGTYRNLRMLKNDPKMVAAKAVGGLTLMSILSLLAMGLNDDDKEKLESMNDVARDKYWWFPIPGTGMYVNFAKPFEYSFVANMAERFLDETYSEVKGARKAGENWAGALSTAYNLNFVNQAIGVYLDISRNSDSSGRLIVPERERNTPKDNQYGSNTSFVAQGIAGGYNAIARILVQMNGNPQGDPTVGTSPRTVDYAMKNLTNVWGDAALRTIDSLDNKIAGKSQSGVAGAEYYPVVGSLLYGRAEGAVRVTDKFYKDKHKAEVINAGTIELIKKKDKSVPNFATPENILLLHTLPMMNGIADELAKTRTTINAKMEKATPEERRLLTIQLKFTEQTATGLLYGVDPVIKPEEAGMTQAQAERLVRHFKAVGQQAAMREREKPGGVTDSIKYLQKLTKK